MTDANIYSTKFQQNLKNMLKGDTFVWKGEESTITATTTFSPTDGNVFFIRPSGANRDFNPSGTFNTNTEIKVVNLSATHDIVFDSDGSAQTISPTQYGDFFYNGTTWY